jgi:Fe(II)/alpha-ketoglutarate-dependent arginine beta-hydroxylase
MIKKLLLKRNEIQQIQNLLHRLSEQFSTAEDSIFLHNASVIAHELPLRIRQLFNDFRLKEDDDAIACIISGYPINNSKIGLTPLNRNSKNDSYSTLEEQMLFVLFGTLLGDLIAWATQQAGHVIHDISPVKGQECEQTGSSSKQELFFHTEDAFHDYRADYLGIMCLRNNNVQAATTIASRKVLKRLPVDVIRILFEPRFIIRPDASQFEKHKFVQNNELNEANFETFLINSEARINQMNANPEPIAILFGNKANPYIRVDCANYMDALDSEAEEAIKIFTNEFNDALSKIALKAGEICFVDNFRAVHGRTPFKYIPKYDGSDRWMKRINVVRDLRKSQEMRMTSTSRIIF